MNPHLSDELAQSLVDGLLSDRTRAECQAHVDACEECRAVVESYAALAEALDGLAVPLPPPDFTDAVMERIDEVEQIRVWERRFAFGILGATALAACVIFAILGASAWAPVVSRITDGLGRVVTAVSVGSDVLSPLVRALRVQIAVGCAALGLPLLLALSRLVPRQAEVSG
jgi:anti-sigma factor RsiW